MSFERAVFEKARSRLGAPYLWACKGDWAVRGGVVVPVTTLGANWGTDCSGLVTTSIHDVGGPDLRGTWGSGRMLAELPEPSADEELRLGLWPDHVGFMLGRDTPFCLEAAGGDGTTLTLADAQARGGKVMLGYATHGPPKALRSLRALMAQHP